MSLFEGSRTASRAIQSRRDVQSSAGSGATSTAAHLSVVSDGKGVTSEASGEAIQTNVLKVTL